MNAEQIAAGLTKAQRDWLLSMPPHCDKNDRTPCAEWWDGPPLYVEAGHRDYWLGAKGMHSSEGSLTFDIGWDQLYLLGLEVRAIAAHIAAQDQRITDLVAERDRLAGLVRSWHYLAVGPDEMGDYYTHKQLVKLSEPYAHPALKAIAGKDAR